MFSLPVYMTGMTMGFSLIIAIGAQNAFVLRQGLRREHVFAVCLVCALSDAVLITAGVALLQQLLEFMPSLASVMRYFGAAFLILYGARSLYAAIKAGNDGLKVESGGQTSLSKTIITCLALTWLNPHAYIDAVLLLGSVSSHFPGQGVAFATGAVSASFIFFFLLGYGAGWLRPLFAGPMSWRLLDTVTAATMWTVAWKLLSAV
jgi:L-lysine exporter family protein LysE/ArgO